MGVNESRALLRYLSLKAGAGNAFFFFFSHAAGLRSGWLLEENLPKLGQAAQKQMRSDTGAKEYSPEPPRAHITECSTPKVALFCEHPSCTDYRRGNREACARALNECLYFYFCVFTGEGE